MSHNFSAIGQVATEPRLFTPAGGAEFCTFRLASGERRYDTTKQEWVDTDPNWFTVNTFRGLARHAHRSLRKGDRVVVAGKLRVRQWESEEKRGTTVEIDADGLGHDMRFGTSSFTKTVGGEHQATPRRDDSPTAEQSPERQRLGPVPGQSQAWVAAAGSDAGPADGSADGLARESAEAPAEVPTDSPQHVPEGSGTAGAGPADAAPADAGSGGTGSEGTRPTGAGSDGAGSQSAGSNGATGGSLAASTQASPRKSRAKGGQLSNDGFTPKLASA